MPENAPPQLSQEEFAQREPLTVRLRGLVRSYPKGVGLIQEFLQNADDAGARSLRVFLDDRSYPAAKLPAPAMAALQGPALVVINDALFSENDWKNIQQIGESGKALDATKTGRFGLGFNSVYNVTDFPILLTGSRIGIFDPHGDTVLGAAVERPGNAWRLNSALWSLCPDLLAPFRAFRLEPQSTEFQGTAFRLPLRSRAQAAKSEICKQSFTRRDFDVIVEKLRHHIADLLLFLKNIQDIDLLHINTAGESRLLLSAHTANSETVNLARGRIRDMLASDHELLLETLSRQAGSPVVSEFEHEIDVVDTDGSQNRNTYRVVSGIFGDTAGQVVSCARQMLMFNEKAVPLAGAAAKLGTRHAEESEGYLFCGLPLPVASPMKGCHVNGFFDLQADRQGLFQDPGAGGSSAVRVTWNRLLLEHCCAQAAALMCTTLSRTAQASSQSVYDHWPLVPPQEHSMLDSFPRHIYRRLRNSKCIAAGANSTWCLPKDVQLLPSEADEKVRTALLSDVFLLPNPVLPDFVSAGFLAAEGSLVILTPATLRKSLRVTAELKTRIPEAPRASLRDPGWILALFEFCVSDGNIDDLLGVPLAYMSDGTLRAFGRGAPICLGGEQERAIFSSMPHWFIHAPLQALGALKESKAAGIIHFSPQRVVNNLGKVLPSVGSGAQVRSDPGEDKTLSENWLRELFTYMTAHSVELNLDRELAGKFQKFPLVPDQRGVLHEMGTAETPLLPGAEDPKAFLNALDGFQVPLATGSEKFLRAVRDFVEAFPDMAVWRLTPRDLIDTLYATSKKGSSSAKPPSMRDVGPILDYLSSARAVRDLKSQFADRIDKLRSLRLFPTSAGQLVSLETGDHYVPIDFEFPEITVEVGVLECGRNQRWKSLYQALQVPSLTRGRLLTQILLPGIKKFSNAEMHRLLFWLRTNLHAIREEESEDSADEIVSRLSEQLPIQCTDGKTRSPSNLYHPDSKFAAPLLGDSVGFPDLAVYKDKTDLWLEFFETLGMVRSPRPGHIVQAIDTVLASVQGYDEKSDQLAEIVEYLDQHWDELNELIIDDHLQPGDSVEWRLSDALSERAWLPAIRSAPRDYPVELLPVLTSNFFKPSEMLARTALGLVGSVRPVCRFFRVSHIQDAIGLQTEPTLEDVLTHFENVLHVGVKDPDQVSEGLTAILNRIYEFLGRHFETEVVDALESDPDVLGIRQRFELKSCIADSNRRLWSPKYCFAESVSDFLGRRVRVRAASDNIDRGLRVLGRRDQAEVTDYVAFFSELMATQKGRPIPESDRSPLRSAYHRAASFGDSDRFLGCPILLETGDLVEATVAVLDDAPWLSERAAKAGFLFMEPNLGLPVAITFGVRLLSSAVYELPQRDHPSHNSGFLTRCGELQSLLRSPELFAGVYRLLKSSDVAVRESSLKKFFNDLSVISVSQLETTLVWTDGNIPVDGSSGSCDVVFDHVRNAVVVSEEAEDVLYERVGAVLANELRLDEHDLGESVSHFVAILRVAPSAIDRHLTKLRVRMLTPASPEIITHDAEDLEGFIDTATQSTDDASAIEIVAEHTEDATSEDAARCTTEVQLANNGGETATAGASLHASSDDENTVHDSRVPSALADEPKTTSITRSLVGEDGFAEHARSSREPVPESQRHSGSGTEQADRHRDVVEEGSEQPLDLLRTAHRSRSQQTAGQSGRARTYVMPASAISAEEAPDRLERRRRVDQAAIRRVLLFEAERGRNPKEMPHSNQGYDIESYLPNEQLDRVIEVKGLSGPWSDFGVAVSREQYRKAYKESKAFWLYVVEFALEPNRARIHAIQDPAELVDEYWFDGGWRALSTERSGPTDEAIPRIGSLILLDAERRAKVTKIQRFGALMRLDIEFGDQTKDQVVYSPRRIRVLYTETEEGTQE